MPQLLYLWEEDLVASVQEAGSAPGPVLKDAILPPPAFYTWTFQPIASCYTYYTTPAPTLSFRCTANCHIWKLLSLNMLDKTVLTLHGCITSFMKMLKHVLQNLIVTLHSGIYLNFTWKNNLTLSPLLHDKWQAVNATTTFIQTKIHQAIYSYNEWGHFPFFCKCSCDMNI